MHISWARLASFCQLGFISDPLIVSKFHNETHDPKGQENKIYTIVSRLFCCNHTCYCNNMVSVTSASRYITPALRYHPRYQSRSSMYIRCLIPRKFAELADAVPTAFWHVLQYKPVP